MSASSSSFYRLAGLSYVRYANLCAEVLRASLKEPFLGKVRLAGCAPRFLAPRTRWGNVACSS